MKRGIRPRIFASCYDYENLGRSYFDSLKYGLENTNCYLLYIDQHSEKQNFFRYTGEQYETDKWLKHQTEYCLHTHFKKDDKRILVIETIKNSRMPFGMEKSKKIQLWKLVKGLEISITTFLEEPNRYQERLSGNNLHVWAELIDAMKAICFKTRAEEIYEGLTQEEVPHQLLQEIPNNRSGSRRNRNLNSMVSADGTFEEQKHPHSAESNPTYDVSSALPYVGWAVAGGLLAYIIYHKIH